MTMPGVTIVAHDVGRNGGMERALFEVIHRLSRTLEVNVISSTLDPSLVDEVTWTRVHVPSSPFIVKYLAFAAQAMVHTLRRRKQVVITNGALIPNRVDAVWVHFSHLDAARQPDGVNTSSELATVERLHRNAVTAASRVFERWSYRSGRTNALIAVSRDAATSLSTLHPDCSVEVIANGVDQNEFAPDPIARQKIRQELGLNDADLAVLFVGGDWQRKGLPMAIEAVAALKHEIPTIQLIVAGSGDAAWLASETQRLGIAGRVHPLGFRSDIAAIMNAADCLVSPSRYETFNLAVYEAASVGLAVCATPVDGVRGLIVDGETGVLVDPDPGSIAQGLRRLLRSEGDRTLLAKACSVAVGQFTWDSAAEQWLELCDVLRVRKRES